MANEEMFHELRVAYPGHPYVAVLGRRSSEYGFKRVFNPFYKGRIHLPNGRQEQVHHLPDASLTYEVEEVLHGKRVRWYAATVVDDENIYRISRSGAEVYAKRLMTIREVIAKYPETAQLGMEED
jgi:hypothetical protein